MALYRLRTRLRGCLQRRTAAGGRGSSRPDAVQLRTECLSADGVRAIPQRPEA